MHAHESLPKSLGELFSDTTALMRTHLSSVFALVLPFVALELLVREGASSLFRGVRHAIGPEPSANLDLAPLASSFAQATSLFVLSLLIVQVAAVAATLFTQDVMGELSGTPAAVVRRSMRFIPRVILVEVLFFAILFGAALVPPLIACLLPIVLEVSAALFLVVPLSIAWVLVVGITVVLRTALVTQIVVLEDAGPVRALLRSSDLMRARGEKAFESPMFRLSILLLVYWALSSSIQGTFLIPVIVIGILQGLPLSEMPPPLLSLPIFASVPLALLEVVANSVVLPLAGIFPTLFYRDLLVRRGEPLSSEQRTRDAPGGDARA